MAALMPSDAWRMSEGRTTAKGHQQGSQGVAPAVSILPVYSIARCAAAVPDKACSAGVRSPAALSRQVNAHPIEGGASE